jgi:hypothetical protein
MKKINRIFLVFTFLFLGALSPSRLLAKDSLQAVPVFDEYVEDGLSEDNQELGTGSIGNTQGEGISDSQFEGNTYLEEEQKSPIKSKDKTVYYVDPYTFEELSASDYAKTVDTSVNADISWVLQDKVKIDTDHIQFKGQDYNIIQWDKLKHESWLDFHTWKGVRKFRDKNPNWKLLEREREHKEIVGRVISCIGECRIYRGKKFSNGAYLSIIKEGDEISTQKNSYLWLFLMDGTLVRISPETSMSFNEINISNKKFFYYTRLNAGHIMWYPRISALYEPSKLTDTDPLFLPLKIGEANIEYFNSKEYKSLSDEEKKLESINPINARVEQYEKINELIIQNNKIGKKDVEVFMVLPNGTFSSKNSVLDVFTELGNNTYVRSRDIREYLSHKTPYKQHLFLSFRGYNNERTVKLQTGAWYEVGMEGRSYKEVDLSDIKFKRMEYLTSRIPTMLMARELLIQKYSKGLLKKTNYEDFAFDQGYRLWDYLGPNDPASKKFELNARKSFLIEYTRRVETTNLRSVFKLLDKLEEEGELNIEGFTDKYYQKAVDAYSFHLNHSFNEEGELLKEYNKSQYYIWLLKNAKGN